MGGVELRFRIDPLLRILDAADGAYTIRDGSPPSIITYDPPISGSSSTANDGRCGIRSDSFYPTPSTLALSINVMMTGEAGVKLFELAPWMVELHLRGTLDPIPSPSLILTRWIGEW